MEKGNKVIYIGADDNQVKWGGNSDPRGVLQDGSEYEVANVEVHSWHTKISLIGVAGKFNSVSFKPAQGKE